jgi:very-short-patch-repair endonuclease
MKTDIPQNVLTFMDYCSKERSNEYRERVQIDLWLTIQNFNISSPIEQLMYCAIDTVRDLNHLDMAEPHNGKDGIMGIGIFPQNKIGKYRCDFLVTYNSQNINNEVIVECDSQEFHERNEAERRYEKARDRFFVKQGYKVFHYTGSEIFKESLSLAREIISYLTETPIDEILIESNFGGE